MTKRKIRYSELGEAPAKKAKPALKPSAVPTPVAPEPAPVVETAATAATSPIEAPFTPEPRPKRNSTPIELARALAAAQAHEIADAASASEAIADSAIGQNGQQQNAPAKTVLAELLMFRIGTERFAVDLLAVVEVVDLPVIHFIPEMPPAMVGVVTVRGSLTPVYSPNVALGLPVGATQAVLIFRLKGTRVGVLIDDVEDAIAVDLRDLRRTPGNEDLEGVMLGVIRHDEHLLGVIDVDALIAACQTAALLETV